MPRYSATRITKRTVEGAPLPTTGDRFVWDSEVRGFGVRLYASGRRVFLYQYQAPETGETRRLTLGQFPAITADAARELAKAAAGTVAHGQDPKREALPDVTIGTVFPDYLKERAGKIAEGTLTEYERVWEKLLAPVFGKTRVAALDEAAVAVWHAGKRATPYAANRAVDLLSAFCAWCERRGYRARHTNPCTGVERFEEQRRGRSLTAEEYRRLGAAFALAETTGIRTPPKAQKASKNAAKKKHRPKSADTPKPASPVIIGALRFLTLSGWREQEVLSLRWDRVDLTRGVAVLQETKSGRSERPLGEAALDVLRALPRVDGNPYVFPGRKGASLQDPKATWQSVKYAAKLEATSEADEEDESEAGEAEHDRNPLRLHDLRHSFTTIARDELGYGDHVIARLVGHTIAGITSRYGEVRDATVRNAANAIAMQIAGYLDGVTEAKVQPFSSKAAG
jgi:integrase